MQFYSKITSRGQKYGGFLLNCAKIWQIVLYWKSRLWVWVDFKMQSVLGHSRKNSNRKKGKNGKRPLEFLDLSFYCWKFQSKWNFTLGNSTKWYYIHWNFRSKTKNQDLSWKFHIIFSGSPFEILLLFLLAPGIFTFYFFNNPAGTSMSSTSPVWMFSGIAHWKSLEKKIIYIEMGTATVDSR